MSVFGEEFDNDWPSAYYSKKLTELGKKLFEQCLNIQKPRQVLLNVNNFIQKSSEFPIKFPIETCRVKSQPKERHAFIQRQISSAYPLIHERVLYLIVDFLEHKQKYGTDLEKALYTDMNISEFIQRLLTKRCISFVGYHDCYLLLNGQEGHGQQYLKVGTNEEEEPLTLEKVLSYDEIKISALLSVTSHSEFINDGGRHNKGEVERDLNNIEKEGVVVGLIGARFAREERMEYEDILITAQQNVTEKCYGSTKYAEPSLFSRIWQLLMNDKQTNREKLQDYRRVWNKFYEEEDYLFEQILKDDKRFGSCAKPAYIFDNVVMKKRFAISLDLLLLEANERAKSENKYAYIHVVGIGLGVWLAASQQEKIFLETFYQRLKFLLPKLNNIGVVHFSWFKLKEWGNLKNETFLSSTLHPTGGIKIYISDRNPHEKLPKAYSDMLPVVSFAWDGNALPGNEFWMGSLTSSGDAAAACSTLITELLNPHINTLYVNGNNLHIASLCHGIIHISDYCKITLKELDKIN